MSWQHLTGFINDVKAINRKFNEKKSSLHELIEHLRKECAVGKRTPLSDYTINLCLGYQTDRRLKKYQPALDRLKDCWGTGVPYGSSPRLEARKLKGRTIWYMAAETSDTQAFLEYGDLQDENGKYSTSPTHRKNHQMIQHYDQVKNKEAIQIWWKSGVKVPELVNINSHRDQVYIRGHGTPGQNYITSAKAWGKKLSYQQVAERLRDSGLPTHYSGKIKCYNCNSASWRGDQMSFAQAFADYMYDLGYVNCTFYGYVGTLDSFYKADENGAMHKYVRHGNTALMRASRGRVQIMPKAVNPIQYASVTNLK